MQRELVEERRWFTKLDYAQGLALAQLSPGPLAAQLAMYLGWVRAGTLGASLVAFGLTYAMLVGLVSGAGMTKVLAQTIAIAAGTPLNFVGQKLWSFKA